jgi:riboflavin kinase/FMN adenylyltransferase
VITLDSFAPVADRFRGAYLAVGNFDGVHLGHARLIGRLRERARAAGGLALALTFDPQPVALLRPESAPVPLTWTERKAELLKESGADGVGVFRTGAWLLGLTAREFFDRVILGQFGARGMIEGPTFGFGRDRGGDARILSAWCAETGLDFEVAERTEADGQIVSSTRIRTALAEGNVTLASRLLGRPHRIRGTVIRGAGRGAGLGVPTANLDGIDVQVPADGVYVARVAHHDSRMTCPAAVHVGPNATFGERARSVEAHLLDYNGDLYGHVLEVDFLTRLRGTKAFAGVDALLTQIHEDLRLARASAASTDAD